MTFLERCRQIIGEATDEKEINGDNIEKKNVISEKDPEEKETTDDLFDELDKKESEDTGEEQEEVDVDIENDDSEEKEEESEELDVEEEPAQQGPQLDEGELEFLTKFIEFTELNCLAKCYSEIFKGFNEILGTNSKLVKKVLDDHKEENKQRLNELKEELKTKRSEIEAAEKANREIAQRKLSLVSLLDKAVKKDKAEKAEK